MAITKCVQTEENLIRMAKAAFPDKCLLQSEELTEGMCNAAYRLTFADGFKTILKISSPIKEGFMTNECNLMAAEVKAMRLAAEKTDIKVPAVYVYDTTRTICAGDYFFMECLEGASWSSVAGSLSEAENLALCEQTGRVQKKLTALHNSCFGLLGDEEHTFDELYGLIRYLIGNVLNDAQRRDVFIGVETETILAALEQDKALFDAIQTPTLVHWDMWEGNIFVKDGSISGIIDWERAMWGEPVMDDRFRRHTRRPAFLHGFGKEELSAEELRRSSWYDILLFLTMMTEGTYREYEDDGLYRWAKTQFEEAWQEIHA